MSISSDPVLAIAEGAACGPTAAVFADIRDTLGVEVVNLIWRHLATMPGALDWVWGALKPAYQGAALGFAEEVRSHLDVPAVMPFSENALFAAGLCPTDLANIRAILNSYDHTNALALVCFSAFLERFSRADGPTLPSQTRLSISKKMHQPVRVALARLTPLSELAPPIASLVAELNSFGEDTDHALVASMYRHLSHWPTYLALVHTLLSPLHHTGELRSLVVQTRRLGNEHGRALAPLLSTTSHPPETVGQALHAIRRFVEHPIARMTGICAIIRNATPA